MSYDRSFLADFPLADDQVSFATQRGEAHAADFGTKERGRAVLPDAVVYPKGPADVTAVLTAATGRGVPVTPYAAGTGLEGGATPGAGGISPDLTRMGAVVDYRPGDPDHVALGERVYEEMVQRAVEAGGPRPESTGSASPSASTSNSSTDRRPSTSCARSSAHSIRP